MRRDDFERMTLQEVRVHARGEGDVQRGKSLYFERPWQQVLDEMEDADVRTIGDLSSTRVRTLYEGISGL